MIWVSEISFRGRTNLTHGWHIRFGLGSTNENRSLLALFIFLTLTGLSTVQHCISIETMVNLVPVHTALVMILKWRPSVEHCATAPMLRVYAFLLPFIRLTFSQQASHS